MSEEPQEWAPGKEIFERFLQSPAAGLAAMRGAYPHSTTTPDADCAETPAPSPFQEFARTDWSALSAETPLPLTDADVERLRALGDPIDLAEVDAIYRPLSALLQLYVGLNRDLAKMRRDFLHEPTAPPPPFVIGVAGSVAVGKSSVSRLLRELMSRWPSTPRVDLVTTDGFLYPNQVLLDRGIMHRKGFPESYDRRRLLRFLQRVKSGAPQACAPVYSHITYDIVPGQKQTVNRPDVLILEGLNVLAPPRLENENSASLTVSDFFDFSIYVDARPADIEEWYVNRFQELRRTAFTHPDSFFRALADISDAEAEQQARQVWQEVNLPNLIRNIAPTRGRATLIISKEADHRVNRLLLRKI